MTSRLHEQAEWVYDAAMSRKPSGIVAVRMINLTIDHIKARGKARGSRDRAGYEPIYLVEISTNRVSCSCPAFQHGGVGSACKHLGLLAARLLVKLSYL
tara:strand:+ start:360 stop:656 length:297 start_codon:yes stop_codon:yes gene_type:complete